MFTVDVVGKKNDLKVGFFICGRKKNVSANGRRKVHRQKLFYFKVDLDLDV